MIRRRMLLGFLMLLMGGMAFTGLQRAPKEEQPFVFLTVLIAAVIGGIVQFASAVLTVTGNDERRRQRGVFAINVVLFLLISPALIDAIGTMLTQSLSLGSVITTVVALILAFAIASNVRSMQVKS